jgi:phosphoenolpyruvate carboxylase
MTQRTTDKDLRWAEDRVNELLKGTGHKVFVGSRYGYKAVDLGYEDSEKHHGGLQKTLVTGIPAGTALMYLEAMETALELKERKLKDVM